MSFLFISSHLLYLDLFDFRRFCYPQIHFLLLLLLMMKGIPKSKIAMSIVQWPHARTKNQSQNQIILWARSKGQCHSPFVRYLHPINSLSLTLTLIYIKLHSSSMNLVFMHPKINRCLDRLSSMLSWSPVFFCWLLSLWFQRFKTIHMQF